MKNRSIISLLTVIAVLLGANLIVMASGTAWAQDRTRERQPERQPERSPERQPERVPQRPQTPPDRGRERPAVPDRVAQRAPRCVGITSVGNVIVLAFDDGTIESHQVPQPR